MISSATSCAGPASVPVPSQLPPKSLTTTFAPCAPSERAYSRPSPRQPPVTTVTRDGREARLHELLGHPGVHVLLDQGAPGLRPGIAGPYLHVHRLTDRPGAGLVAVRPDGYIGFSTGRADGDALRRWLGIAGAIGERVSPPEPRLTAGGRPIRGSDGG